MWEYRGWSAFDDSEGRLIPSTHDGAFRGSGEGRHTRGLPPDFRSIFDHEFSYVWTSLRRLGVPPRDLEDITHDVFVEVFRNLDRYDPTRPLRPWLFAFAFRFASDYRRLARHRVEVYEEHAGTSAESPCR